MIKTNTYLILAICALTLLSCKDILTEQNDGISNTMSVSLNDSIYTLTNVVGQGANGFGGGPFCRGTLNGKYLYVYMKFDDTVAVGSTFHNGTYNFTYTVRYDSSETILSSGFITAEYFSSHRVKGTFSSSVIYKNDTLHFRDGKYDVYIKTSE